MSIGKWYFKWYGGKPAGLLFSVGGWKNYSEIFFYFRRWSFEFDNGCFGQLGPRSISFYVSFKTYYYFNHKYL